MPVVNYHHYKVKGDPTSRARLNEKFGDDWLYVGRRNRAYGFAHSPLANPFVSDPSFLGIVTDDPLGAYRQHLWEKIQDNDPEVMGELAKITPSTGIVCWCAPRPCHADIVARAAAWLRRKSVVEPEDSVTDIVVTVPKTFGLQRWIDEGDLPGEEWGGLEWHFYMGGGLPKSKPGDRVYVVYNGKLRGYAPLVRIERYAKGYALVRHNDAQAVTIDEHIPGFRGFRYRWWDRAIEQEFPNWMVP